MNLQTPLLLTTAVAVLLLSGCRDDTPIPEASAGSVSASTVAAALPADLISAEPIANAGSLAALKSSAKAGDEVTFVAAIGGRAKPFVDGRAVMVVSDLDLEFCTDGCPVPWDACCALPEDITKNIATVQVVDEEGAPLHVGLQDTFKPGSQIQVSGTVDRIEEGATIINARRVHVVN